MWTCCGYVLDHRCLDAVCWCFNKAVATSPLFVSKDITKLGLTLQATFFTSGIWEFYKWYIRYIPPALTNQISALLQLWSKYAYQEAKQAKYGASILSHFKQIEAHYLWLCMSVDTCSILLLYLSIPDDYSWYIGLSGCALTTARCMSMWPSMTKPIILCTKS